MQKLDDVLYQKLNTAFDNIENMWFLSYDILKFKEKLNQNKIFFSDNVLNKLLNPNLKIQIKKLYYNLYYKGFYICKIKINGSYIYNCVYGDKNILNENLKKMYIYYLNSFSKYGKLKYNYFKNNKNIKKYINVCDNIENINNDMKNIINLKVSSLSQIRSIDVEKLDGKNLYIFSTNNFYDILNISDYLFFVESKFDNTVVNLVDNFLNNGKEILVLPGDIWNKNCYFSNFLIKEGADVITSVNDLNLYL